MDDKQKKLSLSAKIARFLLPEILYDGWRAPGSWLVKIWLLAVPVTHVGLVSFYTWNNDFGYGSWGYILLSWFTRLPTILVACISAAVGFIALWRAGHGKPLATQSSLAQATAIFTVSLSLAIAWLILLLLSLAFGLQPPTWESDFLSVFKPLVGIISILMLGLFIAVVSFGIFFIGAVPPAIMCYLILKQTRPSRRTFRILITVSVVFWIFTAVLGVLIASG